MRSPHWAPATPEQDYQHRINRIRFARPKTGIWFTSRDRVLSVLDTSTLFSVATVIAPAGYGKTSALSDWAARSSLRSGWWTLNRRDNNLQMFVTSFVELIQTFLPDLGYPTLALLANLPENSGAPEIAESLASELLDLHDGLVLILDDFHQIDEPTIGEFINELAMLSVPNLHIILSSQQPVPVQTVKLKAAGRLYEINQANLAFTVEEAQEFFSRVDLSSVSPGVIQNLVEATEGWITAIHLSALSAVQRGQRLADISSDSTPLETMLEFIHTEVLGPQSEEIEASLLRLAVPEMFSESLANVLTAGHQPADVGLDPLGILRTSGLVSAIVTEDGTWYKFHSLLRSALLSQLHSSASADEIAKVHSLAFDWFESHGAIESALHHALSAGEFAAAAELVARHGQKALIEDRWLQLDGWITALPWAVRRDNYELLTSSAWIQQVRGRHDLKRELTTAARKLTESEQAHLDASSLAIRLAELDLLDAIDHSNAKHPEEQREVLNNCLHTLMDSGRFAVLPALLWIPSFLIRTENGDVTSEVQQMISNDSLQGAELANYKAIWARNGLALSELSTGNYQAVADKAMISITGCERLGLSRSLALSETILAIVRAESNNLAEAERLARSAFTNPAAGILVYTLSGCLLAKVLNAQGRLVEADNVLEELLESLLQSERSEFVPEVRTAFAQMNLVRGDTRAASAYLRHVEIDARAPQAGAVTPRAYVYAMIHLAENDDPKREQALSILQELASDPRVTHWKVLDVQVSLGLALVDYQSGNEVEAFARLADVISTVERHGWFRVLLDVHPNILKLLMAYEQHVGPSPFLSSVLAEMVNSPARQAISQPRPRLNPLSDTMHLSLIEPLSEREQEVLQGLQKRLSNKEIASELNISPLTVKSHTRTIYGKLGVNSRRQAVARGIQAGVLIDTV